MRKSNFALRLQPSLLEEARKLAEAEGVALNQLINVAVAEKVSALRTADYFAARAAHAHSAQETPDHDGRHWDLDYPVQSKTNLFKALWRQI
jgi:hypothetical protein